MSQPSTYRPEIDGLRALAVLPVVLFHAGIPGFDGGYVGVDVFFVISGYLITSILLADLAKKGFSIGTFYERRARRILPALFVMMLACLPFAWLLLAPGELARFAHSVASTTLFYSNMLFWSESGYFDTAAELKPLLHTWSLAIEEQYYLLFPGLLLLLWRRARPWAGHALLCIALLSLLYAEQQNGRRPEAAFFLLPARAWELLAGAWLAWREKTAPLPAPSRGVAAALASLGVAMIVAAVALFDRRTAHPGLLTLLPVLGTALVIQYGGARGPAQAVLSQRLLVGFGLISYSLYLWHQPLFAFARAWSLAEVSLTVYLLLIALSIVLAWLTWRFVETPFRDRRKMPARQVWAWCAGGAALLLSLSLVAIARDGFPSRFAAADVAILDVKTHNANQEFSLGGKKCANRAPEKACVIGLAGTPPSWALAGDSHAGALVAALDAALRERRLAGVQLTRTGCLYLPGFRRIDARECAGWSADVRARLMDPAITDVVIAGRHAFQLEGTRFDNGEGGREYGDAGGLMPARGGALDEPARRAAVIAGYRDEVRELLAAGKRVHLIYPVPEVGWDVPDRLFRLRALKGQRDVRVTTGHARYLERTAGVREAFDGLGDMAGLTRTRPDALFCNKTLAGRCLTELDGRILYADDDHPSYEGASLIIDELFRQAGR